MLQGVEVPTGSFPWT